MNVLQLTNFVLLKCNYIFSLLHSSEKQKNCLCSREIQLQNKIGCQWKNSKLKIVRIKWLLFQTIELSPVGSASFVPGSSVPQTLAQLKSQSILFAKLFVIMGITWIGECIHVLLHGDHSDVKECNFYAEVCVVLSFHWVMVQILETWNAYFLSK